MAKNEFLNKEKAREAGRKGGYAKKGKFHRATLFKKLFGENFMEKAAEEVHENMMEFLLSSDPETRFHATKAFAEYYVPKRREISGGLDSKITVIFQDNVHE